PGGGVAPALGRPLDDGHGRAAGRAAPSGVRPPDAPRARLPGVRRVGRPSRRRRHGSSLNPAFPPGFFDRADPSADAAFYSWPRLVTHIDDAAIAAAGALYDELGTTATALAPMGSWGSPFRPSTPRPTRLRTNAAALSANP